jgi:L-lactate dehydrogenase complex protein LldG
MTHHNANSTTAGVDCADVLAKVRRALGRTTPLTEPPVPPAIDEPITRLVHSDIGLPELFARRAEENKMYVQGVSVDELVPKLVVFLRAQNCRRIMLPASPFLEKLDVTEGLRQAGFEACRWTEMTLDEAYDFDCGITDVYAAVAETGSLVIRATPEHGRAISLVPPIHVAILEPKKLVPDLVDLFEKLGREGTGSGTIIITGPSKTADIEMNLVVGVHGPGKVHVFLLQ